MLWHELLTQATLEGRLKGKVARGQNAVSFRKKNALSLCSCRFVKHGPVFSIFGTCTLHTLENGVSK